MLKQKRFSTKQIASVFAQTEVRLRLVKRKDGAACGEGNAGYFFTLI